jgi:hypothetical protein
MFRAVLLAVLAAQIAVPATLPGAQAPANQPQATGTAAISGTVMDAATGRPVSGAIVSLRRVDNGAWVGARTLTDSRGRFVFLNLPPAADYYLGARRFGYEYTRYGWTEPDGPLATDLIRRIGLGDGQWVDAISIPLWRFGTIAGRVLDEFDEPVVGVVVRAFSQATVVGNVQWVGGPIATTDDRGAYQLTGLAPGRYTVGVLSVQSTVLATTPEAAQRRPVGELETGGFAASSGNAVTGPTIDVDGRFRLAVTNFATPPPPSSGRSRAYAAVFHPSAGTLAEASPIEIAYGRDHQGIDFRLQPVPTVRVSGQVTGAAAPLPPLLLRLLPVGSEKLGFGSEAATTPLRPDGRFVFLNVPAGRYAVVAQSSVTDLMTGSPGQWLGDAPGYPAGGIGVGSSSGAPGLSYIRRHGAGSNVWGRTTVVVGVDDLDSVELPLQPTGKITGRFVLEDGAVIPPSQDRLSVAASPANGDPTLPEPLAFTTPRDPRLAFTIEGLLGGTYLIRGGGGALAMMSVTWQGRNVTDTGLDVSIGGDFDDVVITLTNRSADVSGVVRDRNGTAAAAVIAFPADRDRWTNYGVRPRLFGTTRSGPTGAYQLRSLPEGEYLLIAVDLARINAWTDPKFLAAAVPSATRLSVRWGEKKTQDLAVANVVVK